GGGGDSSLVPGSWFVVRGSWFLVRGSGLYFLRLMGEERGARVERIPLAAIRPRRIPTRAPAPDGEIHRLTASIRAHGLLQPILVRSQGKEYEVVCGQRRFQACKALGIP